MAYGTVLVFHYVAVLLFGGYILLDRLLFRPFFSGRQDDASLFYRRSRRVLLPSVTLIILSGLVMAWLEAQRLTDPLFILKIVLAVMLMGMFFYCPVFSRGYGEGARRLYRAVVVVLLLSVVVVSKFFI